MPNCEKCKVEFSAKQPSQTLCPTCYYWKAAGWVDKNAQKAPRMAKVAMGGKTATTHAATAQRTPSAKLGPLERDIQKAIHKFLARDSRVAWIGRFNSGAATAGEGADTRYIRMNTVAGCSDLLGQLKTGHMLAVEVKRPGSAPTAQQAGFLEKVCANGGCAGVARSVDDAKRLIDEFLSEAA